MRAFLIAAATAALGALVVGCGQPTSANVTARIEIGDNGCVLHSGDQVTFSSPAGHVIGSVALGRSVNLGGIPGYKLTVRLPAESRYGIRVASIPVYWITRAQASRGANIACFMG